MCCLTFHFVKMSNTPIYLIAFLAAASATFSTGIFNGKLTGPGLYNLKFLATVEGKSYFADRNEDVNGNWTDISKFCNLYGMQLAAINSEARWSALANSYSADFNAFYWTSGRDSHELRQFNWNTTNLEVTAPFLRFGRIGSGPKFEDGKCLGYRSNGNNSYLFPSLCSDSFGALCETT